MADWMGNHVKAVDIGETIDVRTMEPEYTIITGVVFRKSGLYRVIVDGNRTIIEEVPEVDQSCDGCKHEGKYEYEKQRGLYYPCLRCMRNGIDHYEKEDEE